MNVFVITEGWYSDYRIVGVTLDHDSAIRIAKNVGGEVETYETDDYTLSDGEDHYYVLEHDDGTFSAKKDDSIWGGLIYGHFVQRKGQPRFRCTCIAKSPEHALRIAYDRRAMMLAKEKGVV